MLCRLPFLCTIFDTWLVRFITWPLRFVYRLIDGSYPVLQILLVTIGCGLLIGGCAGFAFEAISSMVLPPEAQRKQHDSIVEGDEQDSDQDLDPHDDQSTDSYFHSELNTETYRDQVEEFVSLRQRRRH